MAFTRGVLSDPTDKPRNKTGFRFGGWEEGRVELAGRREGRVGG